MNAQSFCNSYGMDLVALESEHEAKYFTKCCENSSEFFENFSHVGGVLTQKDGWHWIASHKKIHFDLNLKNDKNLESHIDKNCLQLLKMQEKFSYGKVNCFGNQLEKFVCQKMIVKDDHWAHIFGK